MSFFVSPLALILFKFVRVSNRKNYQIREKFASAATTAEAIIIPHLPKFVVLAREEKSQTFRLLFNRIFKTKSATTTWVRERNTLFPDWECRDRECEQNPFTYEEMRKIIQTLGHEIAD